jgi:hypothetical protein
MSENPNNTICSQVEFEQFASIYEQFINYEKDPENFPSDENERLYNKITDFWPTIIKIGNKFGRILPDKPDALIPFFEDIRGYLNTLEEEPLELPDNYDYTDCQCPDFSSEEVLEAQYECLERQYDKDNAISALHEIMAELQLHFQPQVEWITVSEAARITRTAINENVAKGTITRWANSRKIKTNGEKGRARRIDKNDLLKYIYSRKEQERMNGYDDYDRKVNDIPEEH